MQTQWHTRRDEADEPTFVQRYDRGTIMARPHKRSDGSILFEARVAKPGILVYRDSLGRERRELLLEEDLNNVDSLASLGRAPVTLEHPDEDVSPDNFAELGVGDVDSFVKAADGFVTVKLAVRRRDALDAIDRGKNEISPGYRVRIEETSGTHPVFGKFDAIQRQREYNHVAIVDAARGGRDIRLRTDAAYQVDEPTRNDSMNPLLIALFAALGVTGTSEDAGLANAQSRIDDIKAFLKDILGDGIRLDDISSLQKSFDQQRADAVTTNEDALKDLRGQLKESQDALSAMTGERDTLQSAADAMNIENQNKADAAERTRLDSFCVAAEIKLDGADKLDLPAYRRAIVSQERPLSEDKDDAYVQASLDMLVALKADSMGGDKSKPWDSFDFNSDKEKKRADAAAEEEAKRGDGEKSLSERTRASYDEAFKSQKGA